jgi:hypothetical protein
MSDELIKAIKDSLPDSLNLKDMSVITFDWLDAGIEDFTGASNKMRFRINLQDFSQDMRVNVTIWTNKINLQ